MEGKAQIISRVLFKKKKYRNTFLLQILQKPCELIAKLPLRALKRASNVKLHDPKCKPSSVHYPSPLMKGNSCILTRAPSKKYCPLTRLII